MDRPVPESAIRFATTVPNFAERLDRRIGEMRGLLDEMAAPSTADALRALRLAFPDATLHERVRAISGFRR